jgi:enamine deaminase RidA (YjgF/YER057c/UK114 family)
MNAKINLKRSGPNSFVPAPRAVRVGDYVYTSSIYPIDKSGHAIGVDERLGEAGPSLMEAQARHCLESLKEILKEHGSNLDGVLKADVHLVDPADSANIFGAAADAVVSHEVILGTAFRWSREVRPVDVPAPRSPSSSRDAWRSSLPRP